QRKLGLTMTVLGSSRPTFSDHTNSPANSSVMVGLGQLSRPMAATKRPTSNASAPNHTAHSRTRSRPVERLMRAFSPRGVVIPALCVDVIRMKSYFIHKHAISNWIWEGASGSFQIQLEMACLWMKYDF